MIWYLKGSRKMFEAGLFYKLPSDAEIQAHASSRQVDLMRLNIFSHDLVGGGSWLFLLLEPALLDGGGLTSGGLTLHLDLLGFVVLQLVGNAGLLRRWWRLGSRELLDVGFRVTGLDGGGLVGAELTQVEVLDGVGWIVGFSER